MFNKRVLFLILIALWVAEPFLAFTTIQAKDRREIYPEMVSGFVSAGDVCCSQYNKALCSSHPKGLYAANCTPDHARNFFFAQSTTKFMPGSSSAFWHGDDLSQPLRVGFVSKPNPPIEVFTPPPQLDHFV